MIKIKVKYSGTIPTGQYQNEIPSYELEKEIDDDVDIDLATSKLQDILYKQFLAQKERVLNPPKMYESEDDKNFAKLDPEIKKVFKALIYDYCEKRKWGKTKIKTDIMQLFKEDLGEGVAEQIFKKGGE